MKSESSTALKLDHDDNPTELARCMSALGREATLDERSVTGKNRTLARRHINQVARGVRAPPGSPWRAKLGSGLLKFVSPKAPPRGFISVIFCCTPYRH